MAHHILLVEDDPNFGTVLRDFLKINQYAVTLIDDGAKGLSAIHSQEFDLCVLDVMMPAMDGYTLAEEMVKVRPQLPFIFLTAKNQKDDIIQGFRLGASDYITKPFDAEVLLYRIEAALRKGPITKKNQAEIPIGRFTFNPHSRNISDGKTHDKLSPKEAELLLLLIQHKNEVLDREVALRSIWQDDNYFTARSMDVYITKLRKYLREDPCIKIENIHGKGFRLSEEKQ